MVMRWQSAVVNSACVRVASSLRSSSFFYFCRRNLCNVPLIRSHNYADVRINIQDQEAWMHGIHRESRHTTRLKPTTVNASIVWKNTFRLKKLRLGRWTSRGYTKKRWKSFENETIQTYPTPEAPPYHPLQPRHQQLPQWHPLQIKRERLLV